MKSIIRNGTLIYGDTLKCEDMLIVDGRIQEIKESIRSYGDEQIIDGSGYYVLPGFLATVQEQEQDGIPYGVTTQVREKIIPVGGELQVEGIQAKTDYVYRVHVEQLSKGMIKQFDQARIKLLVVENEVQEDQEWLCRLERAGLVLQVQNVIQSKGPKSTLPYVIPYNKWKKTNRPRTIATVQGELASQWVKSWRKWGIHDTMTFWLDCIACQTPSLRTESELQKLLQLLVHIRSRIPAKLLGIYPRKGSLAIGADADLLFIEKKYRGEQGQGFMPSHVMVKGNFWDSEQQQHDIGCFIRANQTYAYHF